MHVNFGLSQPSWRPEAPPLPSTEGSNVKRGTKSSLRMFIFLSSSLQCYPFLRVVKKWDLFDNLTGRIQCPEMQLRESVWVYGWVRTALSLVVFITGGQIETQPFKKMLLLFMVSNAKTNQVLSAHGYIYFECHTIELINNLLTLYWSCYLYQMLCYQTTVMDVSGN